MSGGSSRYAPSDPLNADLTALASVTSPASTSAPRERSSATFSGWRTTTRIFLPASSNLLATTEPVFPLAPKTVNMDSSRSWTADSAGPYCRGESLARRTRATSSGGHGLGRVARIAEESCASRLRRPAFVAQRRAPDRAGDLRSDHGLAAARRAGAFSRAAHLGDRPRRVVPGVLAAAPSRSVRDRAARVGWHLRFLQRLVPAALEAPVSLAAPDA